MAPSPGRSGHLLGVLVWVWAATRVRKCFQLPWGQEVDSNERVFCLPTPLGRSARKALTRALNLQSCRTLVVPHISLVGWSPPQARMRRLPVRLFERQRQQHWGPQPKRTHWSGWPCRGKRIGEASKPGPASDERERSPTRGAVQRIFCPVPGCASGDAANARGWASHVAMRPHLDDHCAGVLTGHVPQSYLQSHDLDLCSVCGLSVSKRFNGTHSRCRPASRQPASRASLAGGGRCAGPDLADIFAAKLPVLKHVPRAARGAWAQCLACALAHVATVNTVAAWQQLLMLPKAVLRPAPRGGAHRRDQAAQFTLRRCQRWLEGEREELWEDAVPRRRRQAVEVDEAAALAGRQSRCVALAAEGELSRACAALTSPALLEADGDTVTKLRDKHPQAPPARPCLVQFGPPPQHNVPDISVEQVVSAVRSFRRGSASGPTGLRGDHLREALSSAGHADEVAAHLTAVTHILVRGEAPSELAPHLAGANLYALPKGSGDVRPIAVGEVFRRLAAKCLCASLREAAHQALWPLQVGVATKLGADTAVHTARQWVQRNAGHVDKVFLKVDFHNAFNVVDRAALLRRLHFPGLAPWAEWCYDRHTRLLFDGVLTSEVGVQQGDPLGPLLFALALQPALQAAQSGPAASRPELAFAFMDDAFLAGGCQPVAASLTRLVSAARQVGLQLNPQKCELIVCGGLTASVDARAFPAGIRVNASGNFLLLGAPIGQARYTEAATLAERVDKARPLLRAIAELPDPQTGLLLLRHFASFCKFVFALRVTPTQLLGSAATAFDSAVRECLESLCTGPLPEEAPGCEAFRAHLQLLQQPRAGAWLHAPPSEALGLHVDGPLFRVMVRLRLRLPVAASDAVCPLCDGIADKFGDHCPGLPMWG